MILYGLMKHLCEDYELPLPKRQDHYKISLDADIVIYLVEQKNGMDFLMTSWIGKVQEDYQSVIFQKLLNANYQEIISKHFVFSFDAESEQIVLSRWINEPTIHYSDFLQILKEFVNHIKRWRSDIQQNIGVANKPTQQAQGMEIHGLKV